jgi:uncharacterized membrane protein YeiB
VEASWSDLREGALDLGVPLRVGATPRQLDAELAAAAALAYPCTYPETFCIAAAEALAAGAMPLTIYTLQLIVIAVFLATPFAETPPEMASWPLLAALVVGSLLFAVLWRRLVGRGPMETAMVELTRVPAPRQGPAATRS